MSWLAGRLSGPRFEVGRESCGAQASPEPGRRPWSPPAVRGGESRRSVGPAGRVLTFNLSSGRKNKEWRVTRRSSCSRRLLASKSRDCRRTGDGDAPLVARTGRQWDGPGHREGVRALGCQPSGAPPSSFCTSSCFEVPDVEPRVAGALLATPLCPTWGAKPGSLAAHRQQPGGDCLETVFLATCDP